MKSCIFLVAALGTPGQATWPPTLAASKPTTQNYSDYKPPLETVTITNFPSAQASSSSHHPNEAHGLSNSSTEQSVSTGPPRASVSLSSLPTVNTPSSRQDTVQHTLSSAPIVHDPSSHTSTVAYSQAYDSSSRLTSTVVTPLSGAPSARSSSSHPVDDNPKPHTVTEYNTRTITVTATAAVINDEVTCMKPNTAAWDHPRRPSWPQSICPVDASMEPSPISRDPPHKVHGTAQQHPMDGTKKYPHVITDLGRRAYSPGFTCQPDDDYTGNNLANERYPTKSPRVCQERYSCQVKEKLPPSPPSLPHPKNKPPPYTVPTVLPQLPTSSSTSARKPPAPSGSAAIPGPATASHYCPDQKHPCRHRHASETSCIPGTVVTAEFMLSVPDAVMYVIIAPIIGLIMA